MTREPTGRPVGRPRIPGVERGSSGRRVRKRKHARPLVCSGDPRKSHLSKRARVALESLTGPPDDEGHPNAPRTRADCVDSMRPCPWVSCRHHCALYVTSKGGLHIAWPMLQIGEVPYTCSLDAADDGPLTLEEVGNILNVSRERVRQIEEGGLLKMRDGLKGHR